MPTISQGLGKAVFQNKWYWVRISRRKTHSLEDYFRKQHGFRYMKVYQFFGSGKKKYSPERYCGSQIGWFNQNKSHWEL